MDVLVNQSSTTHVAPHFEGFRTRPDSRRLHQSPPRKRTHRIHDQVEVEGVCPRLFASSIQQSIQFETFRPSLGLYPSHPSSLTLPAHLCHRLFRNRYIYRAFVSKATRQPPYPLSRPTRRLRAKKQVSQSDLEECVPLFRHGTQSINAMQFDT